MGPGWQQAAGRPVCSPGQAPGPRPSRSGTRRCSTLQMVQQARWDPGCSATLGPLSCLVCPEGPDQRCLRKTDWPGSLLTLLPYRAAPGRHCGCTLGVLLCLLQFLSRVPPVPTPSHVMDSRCGAEVYSGGDCPLCGTLALTIVVGIHPGILHSFLAQLNPHNSLYLLNQGEGTG